MTNNEFWEIVDRVPDLAFKTNLQIRLMGNFGLQYGAPWLRKPGSSTCLLCKDGISHFLLVCPKLEDEWATFWYILKLRKRFQILITLKKIYPQQLDFSSGAFLYRSIAVLRILLTNLLLHPFGRSDKT